MLIKELRLHTKHLLSLYYFYKDLLQLPVIQIKNQIIVSAGETKLIFDEISDAAAPFYHFAFNIPSNKFEEALYWIESKVALLWLEDYKCFIADFVNWHAKSFYFKDPAGNILEMIVRFDLNDKADSPFFSGHIRQISEIGIVFSTDTFDKEINTFMDKYSLSYFDKHPPLPYFRAIGNDEGLFIAVPENRIWFSTKNDAAKKFFIEVFFIQNDKQYHLKM